MTSHSFKRDDPTSYNHKQAKLTHSVYHYVEQGPQDGQVIIFLHGFPESWYCWKYQIDYFAQHGYRVIVPSMKGYGGSMPNNVNVDHKEADELTKYSLKSMSDDLAELLTQVIQAKNAIFVGHDWGAAFLWRICLFHPEIVKAACSIGIPYAKPPKDYVPLDKAAQAIPLLNYQVYFNTGRAEKEIKENIGGFLDMLYHREFKTPVTFLENINEIPLSQLVDANPSSYARFPALTSEELKYLESQFREYGIRGPLSWYRTEKINWENAQELVDRPEIKCPTLLFEAKKDLFVQVFDRIRSPDCIADLTVKDVDGGHWIHLTHHEQINSELMDWIKSKNLNSS